MTTRGGRSRGHAVHVVDTRDGTPASLETVNALARLRLVAQRLGIEMRVVTDSEALPQLILLVGLEDVLICLGDLPVETARETELLEQVGVEEVVDMDDPSA